MERMKLRQLTTALLLLCMVLLVPTMSHAGRGEGHWMSGPKVAAGQAGIKGNREVPQNPIGPDARQKIILQRQTSRIDSLELSDTMAIGDSKITGTVTSAPDCTALLGGILVYAYSDDGGYIGGTYTADNGTYEISGLAAGTYIVEFNDEAYDYFGEYYDNQTDWDLAIPIVVGVAETVVDINACLEVAAKITGTVTGPDCTEPLGNISVWAYSDDAGYSDTYYTADNGTYEIIGLAAGTYKVGFYDGSGNYFGEYYDNQTWDSAIPIVVGASDTVGDIDACLEEASKITGRVTGPDCETPLYDIYVSAYSDDGSSGAYTADNGTYTIGWLAAGTYKVRFYDEAGNYAREYYDNQISWDSAEEIVVDAEETVVDIDACLEVDLPVLCDNNTDCGLDQFCDEIYGRCVDKPDCTINAHCNDTMYCNGVATCVDGTCVAGTLPCRADQTCNETSDKCVDKPKCTTNVDCADDLLCNGIATCVKGLCVAGKSPCEAGQTCDERNKRCVDKSGCMRNTDCADDLYCNGVATCVGGTCVAGTSPCGADQTCDEAGDRCVECLDDGQCADGDKCVRNVCIASCTLAVDYKPLVAATLKKDKKLRLKIGGGEGFDPYGVMDLGPFQAVKPKVNAKKWFVTVTAVVPVGTAPGTYPISVGDCEGDIRIK